MSCTRLYVDPTETLTGQKKEMDSSKEWPKLLVLFFGSCSTKPSFSIITDKLARSGLIAGENDSLERQELENETYNFGRCSLGHATLNWIMMAIFFGIVIRFLSY